MAHLQIWFGLLTPDIATILPWWESLDKPMIILFDYLYPSWLKFYSWWCAVTAGCADTLLRDLIDNRCCTDYH